MSVFERVVTGRDVEQRCLAVLKTWSATYMAEIERQHGLAAGTLPAVRAWVTVPSFDKWPEDQLPAVLLISVGLAESPLKNGAGRFRARWQMGLATICSARTQAESHDLARLYLAAHRLILIQRPSLDGFARGTVWLDENYDDLVMDATRSLSAGQAVFTVEVDDVASSHAGPVTPAVPLEPETTPWPEWPLAETVDVEVRKKEEA